MPDPDGPWPTFEAWWREATAHAAIRYAHAAVLATIDLRHDPPLPDARVVLIHAWDLDGFVVSTDDASPKAEQMRACPTAALHLHWPPLERQIRIRGAIAATDEATADSCFVERPRASRITAWASRQGSGLADRATLDAAWEDVAQRFEGVDDVPRPSHWRAWRLVPRSIEFWQAGARRLHDRTLWTRHDDAWNVVRCWP